MYTQTVTAWGGGGGERQTLPSDSGAPFAGRTYGGGDRHTIFGTRSYGSGYPYGVSNVSTISGRGFPYGVWPISWGSYLGGEEYIGDSIDILRPGGQLSTVQVGTTDSTKWPGVPPTEVYIMIGDRDSILFMISDLVNWCHATPLWPSSFNPLTTTIKPENVIQYYRSSSFALSYPGYHNSFAVGSQDTQQSFGESTPLPSAIISSPFLKCINETIGAALPIIDMPVKILSTATLLGMTFGILLVFIIVFTVPCILERIHTGVWDISPGFRERQAERLRIQREAAGNPQEEEFQVPLMPRDG